MFNFLHIHIFNFVHIKAHLPAQGPAGSPAHPTPPQCSGRGQPHAAARGNTHGLRLLALGAGFRAVYLRRVGWFVCWRLFCAAIWEVCKEGDEEKVRARTWVGAHRCAPGSGTEGRPVGREMLAVMRGSWMLTWL